MAPRGWAALSSRKLWLDDRREGYVLARASNTLEAWYGNVFRDYFTRYHWSLQDDEEPDPSRAYDEPAPGNAGAVAFKMQRVISRKDVCFFFVFVSPPLVACHTPPGKHSKLSFGSKSETILKTTSTPKQVDRKKNLLFVVCCSRLPWNPSIYVHSAESPPAAGTASSDCQSPLLNGSSAQLAADDVPQPRGKKPKTEQLTNVYWDIHKDRLLPIYQKESTSRTITDWRSFMADAWANESAEVRRTVQDAREKRHHAALEKWKTSGLHPLDADTQHRCVITLNIS